MRTWDSCFWRRETGGFEEVRGCRDGYRCAAPSGKGIRDQMLGGYGVATVVVEILLEMGGFDMDCSAELTVTNAVFNVQECDMGGGGVSCELDRIAIVEPFKEGGEGVTTMGPEQEYVANKP